MLRGALLELLCGRGDLLVGVSVHSHCRAGAGHVGLDHLSLTLGESGLVKLVVCLAVIEVVLEVLLGG